MKFRMALAIASGWVAGGGLPPVSAEEPAMPREWQEGLAPGVNWGLAAKYPNDAGIRQSPDVIAAEDFESGQVHLQTEGNRYQNTVKAVTTDPNSGRFCGMRVWAPGEMGPTCRAPLPKPSPSDARRRGWFIREYFKYDRNFDPTGQRNRVGVKGFGVYCHQGAKGGPNVPATGRNWYCASVQFFNYVGEGNAWSGYSYMPYPNEPKAVVGRIDVTPPTRFSARPASHKSFGHDEWHCWEVGLYLNTPGRPDGEVRFWVDGELVARMVQMRYRDIEDLYPTHAEINEHRVSSEFTRPMTRYADNIVIARRYIGPVAKKGGLAARPSPAAPSTPPATAAAAPAPDLAVEEMPENDDAPGAVAATGPVAKPSAPASAAPPAQPETKNQKPETKTGELGPPVPSTESGGTVFGTVAAIRDGESAIVGKLLALTMRVSVGEEKVFCAAERDAKAFAAARQCAAGDVLQIDYTVLDQLRWVKRVTIMGSMSR